MLRRTPISTLFPYTTLFRSYDGSASSDKSFHRGDSIALGLKSRLPLILVQPTYAPETKVGGGQLALGRSEEHTSELQSLRHLVCRLLLEKKKTRKQKRNV